TAERTCGRVAQAIGTPGVRSLVDGQRKQKNDKKDEDLREVNAGQGLKVKADSRKTQERRRQLSHRRRRRDPPAWRPGRPRRFQISSATAAVALPQHPARNRAPTTGRAWSWHAGET